METMSEASVNELVNEIMSRYQNRIIQLTQELRTVENQVFTRNRLAQIRTPGTDFLELEELFLTDHRSAEPNLVDLMIRVRYVVRINLANVSEDERWVFDQVFALANDLADEFSSRLKSFQCCGSLRIAEA
jgi:hypothetical protein